MATKITKEQIIEQMKKTGSCIVGHGLSFGGTRWEMFVGKQRKFAQIIDGRIINGMLKSEVVKITPNGEFVLNN